MRVPQPRPRAAAVRGPAWLAAGALLGGCAQLPPPPPAPPAQFLPHAEVRPPLKIGVLVAGWHTGLVLPAGELGPLRPLLRGDPRAKFLSFGWGNRRFYMARHPGSGDAMAALFDSPSALFVQPAASPAELLDSDTHVHWICADREQLWRVDRYLERSLASPGKPVDLGAGPFPASRFYAATGRYSAVHTCNTWTAAALQYAGLPVSATGVLFSSQVARRIRALRACSVPQ
jgi:hypothetical protein